MVFSLKGWFVLSVVVSCVSCMKIDSENFEFKIAAIHDLIDKKDWNCTDVTQYFLKRSTRYNDLIHAVISYNPNAIAESLKLDEFYFNNNRKKIGKLHCIPVLVKDNIDVKGLPTTGGIKSLRYSIPNKDALVVSRLKSEGALILGKTNLAELAAGSYYSELGGGCLNPYDLRRSCGPSSTGSGAAIAAGFAIIALGTDTEGSLMNPASFCGLFSIRPPHSYTNIDGIIPAFERQDTVGALTKYFDDLVLTYSIMFNDSTTYKVENIEKKFKIGFLKPFLNAFNVTNVFGNFTYLIDKEIFSALKLLIQNLEKDNVEIVEISMTEDEFSLANDASNNIVIESATSCTISCVKSTIHNYFNNAQRFQSDAPYHSFDDLKKSPNLNEYWKNYFEKIDVQQDPGKYCDTSCFKYDQYRANFTRIVSSWFSKYQIEGLLFPTLTDLAYTLNSSEPLINISPTFFSPYTGFASLNIPAGMSKQTPDAPNGIPIGIMILTPPQSLSNTLSIANRYVNNHMESIPLPHSTPLIKDECSIKNASSSLKLFYFQSFIYLFILTVTNKIFIFY